MARKIRAIRALMAMLMVMEKISIIGVRMAMRISI